MNPVFLVMCEKRWFIKKMVYKEGNLLEVKLTIDFS